MHRRTFIATSAVGVGVVGTGACIAISGGLSNTSDGVVRRSEIFPKLSIGMNLASISDWAPGFPFRNMFFGSRPWVTRNESLTGPHDTHAQMAFLYDNDGYPLQVPIEVPGYAESQIVFTYVPNQGAAGVYLLLYDGEGEIESMFETVHLISHQPGRVKFYMEQGNSRQAIIIKRSKLGNHIRNIRLVAEEDEGVDLTATPFLPDFLDFCRPFHCLRFMDWGAINNSIEEEWAGRKRPTFYTQTGTSGDPDALIAAAPTAFQRMYSGGVAIETMIQLCNELKINPWFCIPHRATDEYIANFAKLVKERLDPTLKVYLEYSNEIWNRSFLQARWLLRSELAGAIVEAKGGSAWKDQAKTEGKDHPERIGALFRRAFRIWEIEWSGIDRSRLIRVCSVQGAWVEASQRTIRWCMENGGADTVSPAAYVGPDNEIYDRWERAGARLTPEQVIADLMSGKDLAREGSGVARIVSYAARFGLKYVAYEGGQHIQPKGQAELSYSPALTASQYHPAMHDLYIELLRFHRDLGCELFCHYNSVGGQGSRWGSWGAKKSYTEPDSESPKMKALTNSNIQKAPLD